MPSHGKKVDQNPFLFMTEDTLDINMDEPNIGQDLFGSACHYMQQLQYYTGCCLSHYPHVGEGLKIGLCVTNKKAAIKPTKGVPKAAEWESNVSDAADEPKEDVQLVESRQESNVSAAADMPEEEFELREQPEATADEEDFDGEGSARTARRPRDPGFRETIS
ncbi:hypothetical protein CONLIGDRAFT_685786 [Coniochaeta ligniaria NRRL 30616]|uniref:Uncharacterized protein n=1 Tax=Coniochaeta ligniaria NRRL 30616 TaxID=1408157 RepID=A0A1J7J4T9_9PEZI|nr:hypothetical protein CONLIGDRAFT_685786 [Coniochaeta ligniaria NRRL 30616]